MCYKCFNTTNIAYFATFLILTNVVSPRAIALAMAMPALALALALARSFEISRCRDDDLTLQKKIAPKDDFFNSQSHLGSPRDANSVHPVGKAEHLRGANAAERQSFSEEYARAANANANANAVRAR